ncbi:MAG: sulfite exporter TauE/SafE family protein [Deltaproteobacteria bacterium]|nr:sulfite exporter TauE/SafE family protein [Deltaproteobacteria bacterium]MBW2382175.1 sulfite exporter TauE/SafE family protein [Deltaproteobacteria bacterium]
MSAMDLFIASVLVAVGAIVQGSIGFGMALVAAPLLALLDPRLVPGPLILAGVPLVVLIGWRERGALVLRGLGWPIVGQLAGTVVALGVLQWADRATLSAVIGGVILLAVVFSLVGTPPRPTGRNLAAAGTLAGFMGTTSSIPGPPLALVHQHVGAARLRATLVPFFLVGSFFSLSALALAGRLGRAEFEASAALLPGIVLGFALSSCVAERIDARRLRGGVLLLSALGACVLIFRSLQAM